MIRRKRESTIGFVIDSGDSEKFSWCPKCLSRNTKTKLGEKIIMDPTKPPSPADENFMQCHKCYYLVPLYNVKFQGDIYSDLPTMENPFDFARGQILGNDDTLAGRTKRIKRRRSMDKVKDPEIQAYLDNGWELTAFSQEMPVDPNQEIVH